MHRSPHRALFSLCSNRVGLTDIVTEPCSTNLIESNQLSWVSFLCAQTASLSTLLLKIAKKRTSFFLIEIYAFY